MADLRVELDLREIDEGLREMSKAGFDPKALFKRQRPLLRSEQKKHFEDRAGPSGAWAPRAQSSIRKVLGNKKRGFTKKGTVRKGARRRLRNQLGRLKTAWRMRQRKGGLSIESKAPWADIHQVGGTAGHGSAIPARPFVFLSDAFADQFVEDYRNEVLKAWG